ncbi:MAG: hypothetical protein K2N87_18675 [Eubacterium sp.]|nr:hypothetical protein [Eubacterium sp.]
MSMEIKGSYDPYKADYAEQLKAKKAQEQEKAEKTEKVDQAKQAQKDERVPAQDAYISSGKSGAKPSGLYRVGQDEHGNRKIFYDDPKQSDKASGEKNPKKAGESSEKSVKKAAGGPEKPIEECVSNTDKVDREIKKLKEKRQQLEQQIRSALGDEKKIRELEKKLAQVENELSQKDNDTYRKQHSTVTEG